MEFQELLVKIASELDRHAIPYMVIGGQAVLLYIKWLKDFGNILSKPLIETFESIISDLTQ